MDTRPYYYNANDTGGVEWIEENSNKLWCYIQKIPRVIWWMVALLSSFLTIGPILQLIDPAAGILDIGILSVLLVGLIGGLAAILCSLWLQELLWQPFKLFRKQLQAHFNQLTSWQQCILYFAVFFLLLYAVLWGLAMVL